MKKIIKRILLFIPAQIFGLITFIRNLLYSRNLILKSTETGVPLIGFGNLAVGGTGKTPHTLWLASLLKPIHIAILSRGYGRKGTHFRWVEVNDEAAQSGDEPLLIKQKLPQTPVAVCANRVEGVFRILAKEPETEVVLLDDVMQHRSLRVGFLILLSTWDHPYYRDMMLPAGNLREWTRGRKRAQAIIVTQCPPDLSKEQAMDMKQKLRPFPDQEIYFTHKITHAELPATSKQVYALSALANNDQFYRSAKSHAEIIHHFRYPDHYTYTAKDVKDIMERIRSYPAKILCSEKDWVKLYPLHPDFETILIPLKLEIRFLFDGEQQLLSSIGAYIDRYRDRFGDISLRG